jgi:TonB family protein
MKTNVRKIFFTIIVCGMSSINCARAQQNETPKDDKILVLDFKDLAYPALAQQARIQGAVAVELKIDDNGKVTDAVAISGSPILAIPAVNNVRKWHFRPNPRKSVVIVYNFIFLEGRCESHGSLFVLQPSNLATVIACPPAVNTSTSR